ncbi:hypothetical protein T01_12367, partial [Trichinella spiralis]
LAEEAENCPRHSSIADKLEEYCQLRMHRPGCCKLNKRKWFQLDFPLPGKIQRCEMRNRNTRRIRSGTFLGCTMAVMCKFLLLAKRLSSVNVCELQSCINNALSMTTCCTSCAEAWYSIALNLVKPERRAK